MCGGQRTAFFLISETVPLAAVSVALCTPSELACGLGESPVSA